MSPSTKILVISFKFQFKVLYTVKLTFSKFQIICDEEDDDDKRKETENKLKSQSIIGGENGESWSNAGRLNNFQNCFQTFRY